MKVTQRYEILAEVMNPSCDEKYHGRIIPFKVISQWKNNEKTHTGLFFEIKDDWDLRINVCEPVMGPGYNIGLWLTKARLIE